MIEEIRSRKSTRKYKDVPVEDEKITQLLESARLAPSGNNAQPWHFIIIRSKILKEKIADVNHNQSWMVNAPVHIVCVADMKGYIKEDIEIAVNEESPHVELKQIICDTAIAAEHIVLEAESIGLSSCWTAWFMQDDIRPLLDIPSDKYVVSVITIGYADSDQRAIQKKALSEIIHYDGW